MQPNLLLDKLATGKTVWGTFFAFSDANLAELCTLLGWDFLIIDAEHGPLDPRHVGDISRVCELRSVTPIVRVPGREKHLVNRYLDTGAQGVMFPMIDNAVEAMEAVRSARYPPLGARGLGAVRTNNYLLSGSAADHISMANEQILVITQVEALRGVETLDDVLSVDEIDIIFLGSSDLSTDMGLCEQLDDPGVREKIEVVAKAVRGSGKIFATIATTLERAKYVRDELGAKFIATDLAVHISDGCSLFLDAVARIDG